MDPDDTQGLKSDDKAQAKEALANGVEALRELQDMLYAEDDALKLRYPKVSMAQRADLAEARTLLAGSK